jgi:tRNA U34 5-methylaminomethyl-2-thiouridine-forming methyltransferase MnmC
MVLTPQLTQDGSFTFYSEDFDELFHSHTGAQKEAQKKYVEPCQLAEKASQQDHLTLLDICYGLGYNSAAALTTIWSVNPNCFVELIALELDGSIPQQALAHQLLTGWSESAIAILTILAQNQEVEGDRLRAKLWLGDARKTIQSVVESGTPMDAIFLDPFSTQKCPQLWTVEFLTQLALTLKPEGYLATYSCAASVRKAMQLAGLNIASTPEVGRYSPGTLASHWSNLLPPLSQKEQEHLHTLAAIPYRDPTLSDLPEIIHQRRQIEQDNSDQEPSSRWKKRWQSSPPPPEPPLQ